LTAELVKGNVDVWWGLMATTFPTPAPRPYDYGLEEIWREMVRSIFASYYWKADDVEWCRKRAEEFCATYKMAPPWAEGKTLDAIRGRWARISSWAGRLHVERPSIEAIKGNIANVEKLSEQLDQLDATDDQADELAGKLGQALDQLRQVAEVCASWDGDGFDLVKYLVVGPVKGPAARDDLEAATVGALSYALALSYDPDRIEVLQRELNKRRNSIRHVGAQTPHVVVAG
jgi:hypothetical protein